MGSPARPDSAPTPTTARSAPEDTGWRPTLSRNAPPIAQLRTVYLACVAAPCLFLSSLSELEPQGEPRPLFAWVLVALSAYGAGALVWFRRRPLRTSSGSELLASYRTRFLLGLAYSESPVLFGFAGYFLAQEMWIYLVGMGFGLVALAIAAPTRRDTERLQAQITTSGSPLSLWELLTTPTVDSAVGELDSSGDMEPNDEEIPLPPKGTIDASQAWFWTQEWQAGEREADEDIEAGRGELFMSGAEFLGALEKLKPAHKGKRA